MNGHLNKTSQTIIALLILVLGIVTEHSVGVFDQVSAFVTPDKQAVPSVKDAINAYPTVTLDSQAKKVDLATMWEVWNLLEKSYLEPDKIETEKMIDGAIAGMTSSLGDPYTMYLPPEDNKRSGEELAGSFYGVGIELGYLDGVLTAVTPLIGSPAEAAGVLPGDYIIRVKDEAKNFDEDTTGWGLNEAVSHIRGKKGTKVTLTLFRKTAEKPEPFEVTIVRDEIIVKSVELKFIEQGGKKVAHIRLSRFGERTIDEWDEAVQAILKEGASVDGVLLDMRNNPGGFFDDAIYIASEFITDGSVVLQKGQLGEQTFDAKGKGRLKNMPVEVLVNKGSASASEIVAGALRDRMDAKLIGEQTFGKGTVQTRQALSNGGGIHVTIARWMLPKGEWIHDTGIPVNIEVKNNPETEQDEVIDRSIQEI